MKLSQFQNRLAPLYNPREARNIYYLLLQEILRCSFSALLVRGDEALSDENEKTIESYASRLSLGEPLQHILGYTYFCGYQFSVSRDVLIPRPETEELVEWICKDSPEADSLLDIGTGSGCIAVSLKKKLCNCDIFAMDISEKALSMAKENALSNQVDITFLHEDILSLPADSRSYSVIVSNPPYITQKEKSAMHVNVLEHEPHLALFVHDDDPLLFYRAIAQFAQQHLQDNGFLYFEINENLGKETCELLQQYNFHSIVLHKDMNGKDRMIQCRKQKNK